MLQVCYLPPRFPLKIWKFVPVNCSKMQILWTCLGRLKSRMTRIIFNIKHFSHELSDKDFIISTTRGTTATSATTSSCPRRKSCASFTSLGSAPEPTTVLTCMISFTIHRTEKPFIWGTLGIFEVCSVKLKSLSMCVNRDLTMSSSWSNLHCKCKCSRTFHFTFPENGNSVQCFDCFTLTPCYVNFPVSCSTQQETVSTVMSVCSPMKPSTTTLRSCSTR